MFHSREAALSKIELARQAVRDHRGESNRAIADRIGVSHMTVARARNMKDVPLEHADVPPAPEPWAAATVNTDALRALQERPALGTALADGFYQVHGGKPYRIACEPGDVFHVDDDGALVPGPKPKRRSVAQRAE